MTTKSIAIAAMADLATAFAMGEEVNTLNSKLLAIWEACEAWNTGEMDDATAYRWITRIATTPTDY